MAISDTAVRLTVGVFRPPLARARARTSLLPQTWSGRVLLAVGAVALLAAPIYSSRYALTILVAIAFATIGSIAMNLILGVAGQASIGNAAFMAIGAFAGTFFGLDLHLPFPLAIVLAGLFAGLIGVVIGIPAMRVRGLYLVIATLALHYVALYVLNRYQSWRVGNGQFMMPSVSLADHPSIYSWFYIVTLVAVLSVVVMQNLLKTRYGRAWVALARDEIAAEVLGVDVRRQKVIVFGFTSFLIGLQGALFGYYLGVVSTDSYTFDLAVAYVAMVIIGGHASPGGSVLGAIFVTAIPYVVTAGAAYLPESLVHVLTTRLFDIETIIYGAAIVLFLVVEPRGLIYLWTRAVRYFSTWPLSHDVVASGIDE
jgi:branched-chain amino acid transport system permease protein